MENTCGLGSFRPKWLNNFASARCFMAVYGLLGTIQAMAYVYLVVTLTTMEKRFKIPSRTTGIILTGNEISQILLSLILSYHGAHRNRPQWIAWGVVFSALSCFIVFLPHLIYGSGRDAMALTKQHLNYDIVNNLTTQSHYDRMMLCSPHEPVEDCSVEEMGDLLIVPLVFLSQFILGIGNTLYISLGQTYLDDNTKKTQTPILLGWAMALRTFGPIIGFVLGYICLSLYIDPSMDPIIDKKDPRWLGAWWLGWIFLGAVMLIFAIPVAMFPQHMPVQKRKTKALQNSLPKEEEPLNSQELEFAMSNEEINYVKSTPPRIDIPSFKDFPSALKRLLKNKILMFNNIATVFYILGASGYITYISKYLEVQFQESATNTVITGPSTLVGMVAGFLISGYVISKYKPGPKWLLGWNILVGIVYVLGEFIYIFLDCPIIDLHSYSGDPNNLQLIAQCNSNCSCGHVKYSPVCAMDTKTTYYSPCHAGCTTRLSDSKNFANCSCAFQNSTLPGGSLLNTSILREGPCLTDCSNTFYTFVFISFIINLMGSTGKIGNLLVNYRSVDVKDKSFAQGLALWMISLMALIPGPIMYGIIIDSACLVWDTSCNRRGNCWTYDRKKMRVYLNSTAIALTGIGLIFDTIVWYLGRSLNLYGQNPNKREIDQKR